MPSRTGNRDDQAAQANGQRGQGRTFIEDAARQVVTSSGPPEKWGIPAELRPPSAFNRRYVKPLFELLGQLELDLLGAEFALVNYMTMCDPQGSSELQHTQERARNRLTAIVRIVKPTGESIASATNGVLEAQGSVTEEGKLTAEQVFWTEMFLLHAFGMRCGYKIEQVAGQLKRIATKWQTLGNPRREALARFVLGNIYHISPAVRDTSEAAIQMITAVTLIGVAYGEAELIELMTELNPTLVKETVAAHPSATNRRTSPASTPAHA